MKWSAGVLAGWPGGVLAADPPDTKHSLVTAAAQYTDHEFGSFAVDRIFLFRSNLKPTGAEYERIKEYLL